MQPLLRKLCTSTAQDDVPALNAALQVHCTVLCCAALNSAEVLTVCCCRRRGPAQPSAGPALRKHYALRSAWSSRARPVSSRPTKLLRMPCQHPTAAIGACVARGVRSL